MRYLRVFGSSVLAGIAIGIGGTVFLSVESKSFGSFLFSLGLLMICAQGWHLFTGKIGLLCDQKPSYLIDLAVIWLGNLAGTALTGGLLLLTRVEGISERAAEISATKLNDSFLSILILSFFCGFLIQAAVWIYKNAKDPLTAIFGLTLPIIVFILCGFEHCVANMFYFTVGRAWDGHALVWDLVMTLGNSLGGLCVPVVTKVLKLNK